MARAITYVKKHPKKLLISAILLIAYYFCLPEPLFDNPISTVVESRNGRLLGAKIADDGQWRFPLSDSIPYKFRTCLLQFEDAHFYKHPGFNPISILKAVSENLSAGKIVRGGSTLTQQVIRLSRKEQRSYWEKFLELILATRLELRYSKDEILKLYSGNAPFGGNVVGLEMAAWRYFGLQPYQLSWAESATLAVLPNAPSLIYPGKNQHKLLQKRDKLLQKLLTTKIIDSTTYSLALLEELPLKPHPLPKIASHLVSRIAQQRKGERLWTTIDENLQSNLNAIVAKHYGILKQNQVHNAAVLVLDIKTRQTLAYVGNSPTTTDHAKDVDMIRANRSTGSTLKPLLYAAMMDAGELLPNMLIADVPTQIAGYTPENFDESYSGAVEARRALSRSLNIPAVRLLQSYGLEKFRDQLDFFKLGGITESADHYGLTLILGGAETNLWDLCKTYAGLAGTINHFNDTSSEYYDHEFCEPIVLNDQEVNYGKLSPQKPIFDAGSIYLTFEAMKEVNRPDGSESWEFYDSSKEIAWKTGTSFGNKDAWAIGLTKDYVVGVWAGNADGEGRPDLTGVRSAAPILFDVFDIIPESTWFQRPLDEFIEIEVCAKSGYYKLPHCPGKKILAPKKENKIKACNYHQMVHLDKQRQFRLNSSCTDLSETVPVSWFVLPPLMEFYFKKSSPSYVSLPPLRDDCQGPAPISMDFIYPKNGSRISLTKNFEGEKNELVLKLAHTKPNTKVFWYLDDRFIEQTQSFHELGIIPDPGKHKITALDELGNEIVITITIE